MSILEWVGRAMLVTIYLWSALLHKTRNFTVVSRMVGQAGVPFPRAATVAASTLELVCSLVILFPFALGGNVAVMAAAIALAAYTMLAASLFHPFWRHVGEARLLHLINFLKNIGLTGAFLLLFLAHRI
jgi:putative oxidoreductase